MTATKQLLRRIRRSDGSSEHLLVNLTQVGPNELDLNIVGTDKANLYVGSTKDASIKSLRASNFAGSLEDWMQVLYFALMHQRPDGPLPEILQGVELVAAISDSTATITIRRNVAGITQRLGTIKLDEDDSTEINALDWTETAVESSDDLRARLVTLQDSVTSQQAQIAKLNADLESLVIAKREHEDELLAKLAALLNSKKLKIRDQQRLLADANVDIDTAEVVRSTRASASNPSSRTAGVSRRGKRKANDAPEPTREDLAEDEDADEPSTGDEDDEGRRRQQQTPETESEEELEAETESHEMATGVDETETTRSIATRQRQPSSRHTNIDSGSPQDRRHLRTEKIDETVAREPTTTQTSVAQDDVEEQDDETDDEL